LGSTPYKRVHATGGFGLGLRGTASDSSTGGFGLGLRDTARAGERPEFYYNKNKIFIGTLFAVHPNQTAYAT